MASKTDNHNPAAKLALRRQLLGEFVAAQSRAERRAGLAVCDCFSGSETLWSVLRAEFKVREYLALDVKPKRARLKLDSLRYLENQQWEHDVIDLDAYGSPWRHYFEVLKRRRPCLVFLTIGNTGMQIQQTEALAGLGITFKVPGGLHAALAEMITERTLGAFHAYGLRLLSAWEASNPGGSARYIGLRFGLSADPERRTYTGRAAARNGAGLRLAPAHA